MSLDNLLQLATIAILVGGFFLQLRKAPSEIRATTAATRQDDTETKGIALDNDSKLYKAYKDLLADMTTVMREQAVQALRIDTQDAQIAEFKRTDAEKNTKIEAQGRQILDLTRRAENAEKELEDMRAWVPDKIKDLQATIAELRGAAKQVEQTRATDADTRNELAKSAEAQRVVDLATPPTGTPVSPVTSPEGATVQVAIEGQLIPPKADEGNGT